MVKQHVVVSEWLLEEFAAPGPGGPKLVVLDKQTNVFRTNIDPSRFLTKDDAHPSELEAELSKHESGAKLALMKLSKRMEGRPVGCYALLAADDENEEIDYVEQEPSPPIEGMRLTPAGAINVGDARNILSIARYMALIHGRSPRMSRWIARYVEEFEAGARREIIRKRLRPPDDLGDLFRDAGRNSQWAALRSMQELEAQLISRTWWVIKTAPDDRLVLSDSPVLPVVALGHAVRQLSLLATDTLVIAMPLSPHLAIVATDGPVMPISGTRDFALLLNRTTWPWADRYIISADEEHIRSVEAQLDGPRDIEDDSPDYEARRQGRSLARARIIPVLRVHQGMATDRDHQIVAQLLRERRPRSD